MKLQELLESVKDKKLSREQLENYSDELSHLFTRCMLEMSEIEKKEALFMSDHEGTAISRKIAWKATRDGQRLIELKRYSLGIKEMLRSLKSRIYKFIY